MTKKIAIATMTGSANYGNALQNYAVLRLIEQCGYEAETLHITTKNGYPDAPKHEQSLMSKLKPGYIRDFLHLRQGMTCGAKNDSDFAPALYATLKENADAWKQSSLRKQARFNAFKKETLKYTDFDINNIFFDLPRLEQYAAFVTGSDQVWNPYYKTNSLVEFLQFAPQQKRIALAPSFGVSAIPESRANEYSQWISEIPHLSVREEAGAKIIRELTGREATVLLDPTFGLTKEEWISFARKPKDFSLKPDSYVFCYFLGNRTCAYTKAIHRYAEKNHCQIIDVYDVQQLENYCYDPQEFVWLLVNAKAVFTDSFHGCAFAINMQKPFVVFDRVGDGCITQSSRITTILDKTGLQERKFEKLKSDQIDRVDFSSSQQAITEGRKKLIDYLRNSLEQAVVAETDIHLAPKRHCTGCGVCSNVCPKQAISMTPDSEGFLFPTIDSKRCIKCGACEKVCPADATWLTEQQTEAYYAFSKDETICKKSSSGGMFTELARNVIANGGIIYGAGYDADFKVVHTAAETMDELENLRTSKYVQSDTRDVYRHVQEQLQKDRQVLFSGTPCQVVALKAFLGKNYNTLLTVDIICHGVPSPGLWETYLDQNHRQKTIQAISFRDKSLGWNDFAMKVSYTDGTAYRELATKDHFERAFLANLTLRPSCYQCQYKTIDRVSDITIADYWGVETVHPELKEQQGVSLVLVHTSKGQKAFDACDKHICFGTTDLMKATSMNTATTHSVHWPEKRNLLFETLETKSFNDTVELCLKKSKLQRMRTFIIRNGVRVKAILRKTRIIR